MDSTPLPHIAIFPFMSKGHTIPLIHLAQLIHRRRLATLTFFTTPLNAPFIRSSLTGVQADIVELPFPDNIPDIPVGVESTDSLPSMSLFLPFVTSTQLLRLHFENAVSRLPVPISFLISDGFLGWTNESAAKFGIPRMVFYGMGAFASTVLTILTTERPHAAVQSRHQPFAVPGFPNLQITKADLSPPFDDPDPSGPFHEWTSEQAKATKRSHGFIVNSFYELEAAYVDRWNRDFGLKSWCVGPVCMARPKSESSKLQPELLAWLDSRLAMKRPVLYVAFGTQAQLPAEQLQEIAIGLEKSGLDFLWVVRLKGTELEEGFEERVEDRGKVVKEWVDQMDILQHESVKGFISHCGWNSVMESVNAGVPIMAWPMLAEQGLNAKFVVEELRIGVRVRAKEGLVRREDIEEMARELLVGEKGKMAAEKAKELAAAATTAMSSDGSSAVALEKMIHEVSTRR